MNMREIRKKSYNVFHDCESGAHSEALKRALCYIDQLGAVTQTDISDWDITEIFKNPGSEKGFIYTDKNKINAVFFEEMKKPVEKPVSKLSDDTRLHLKGIFREVGGQARRIMQERESSLKSQVEAHRRAYEQSLGKWIDIRHNIESNNGIHSIEFYMNQIDKILAGGFWTMTSSDQGTSYLTFESPEIVLSEVNEKADISYSVPLGRFFINLHFNGVINIGPLNPTKLRPRSVYHPHVAPDGTPCFGNLASEYHLAVEKADMVSIMDICKQVLTNYCPENPFAHLHEFRDMLAMLNAQQPEPVQSELPLAATGSSATTGGMYV